MATSENGIIHIYIYALYILHMYIYNHVHTFKIDVSKWGVLGSADDDSLFSAYSVIFSDHVLFCWSWEWFSQIPQISAYSTYSKCDIAFFCISWQCLLFMERFVWIMRILHICSIWKTRDGRKCVKNFGVLGVSGLNK